METKEEGEKRRQEKKNAEYLRKTGKKGKRSGGEERPERQEEGERETKRDKTEQKIFDKK